VCQSGVCGCNGAAPPTVCLPAGYPTHCSSGAPNWWSCFEDFECQSGWCGCNYDPWPPKCLPNTSYPKTCL
jgi:hypothetical protein